MAAQLDILALEPFYNAPRRAMLEMIQRCSRHRWTVLKLPPRRIERRLSVGATWFAEHLFQHFSGNIDVIFTSDAMNLTSLQRLVPELASKPSIVYFHENYLPELMSRRQGPLDLVNLSSAIAAREIWFNSNFHQRDFLKRAASLVARHPELATNDPMPRVIAKSCVAPPPVDMSFSDDFRSSPPERQPDMIFVETRDADMKLLNAGLEVLAEQRPFHVMTVGPIDGLSDRWPRTPIREADTLGQTKAMFSCSAFLSTRMNANHDHLFVRATQAGCRIVAPATGVYLELASDTAKSTTLYLPHPANLAQRLIDQLDSTQDRKAESADWRRRFGQLDPLTACRKIDERLDKLSSVQISAA